MTTQKDQPRLLITTPIGEVDVIIHGAVTCGVFCNNAVLRGIPYSVNISLTLQNDVWVCLKPWQDVYVRRQDNLDKQPSRAARDKLITIAIQAANNIQPAMLQEAKRIFIHNQITELEEEQQALRDQIQELEEQKKELVSLTL